jgi:hypothetical protein
MGGDPNADEDDFDFGHGLVVKKIRRSKLKEPPTAYADIKTLMSKEHRVIDLPDITQSDARRRRETDLMLMRGRDDPGLLALYPIDPDSPPDAQNRESRTNLDAPADVIGVGLVFPSYMSADLTRLGLEPDEIEQPEAEDPDADDAEAA